MTLYSQRRGPLSLNTALAIIAADKYRKSNPIDLPRVKLYPAQQQIVREASRFNTLACGRRWGKTELGTDLVLETLSAGYSVGWFAPTYKIFTEAWNRLMRVLTPYKVRSHRTERVIEVRGGGVLEGWTLDDENAGRSRKYKRIIVDEAGMIPYLGGAWDAALRPTLTDLIGDAWFLGTPRGRNYFWQLWAWGQDETLPEYASWQRPTSDNPYIASSEIEAAQLTTPEDVFRQEYLAAFLENEGSVFRNLDNTLVLPPGNPAEHEDHYLVMGADWGKHMDFTALSVGCVTCRQEVALERFNKIDYLFQRERLKALRQEWHNPFLLAEANSMEAFIEMLQSEMQCEPFTTTAQNKPQIIENMALTLEKSEWLLLDDPVARSEAEAYERHVSDKTGRSSYSAPEGMHDDTVMARALMLQAASRMFEDAGEIVYGGYQFSPSNY